MAGYSGTPLPKKLGIKPKFRVALLGIPDDVKSELQSALSDCEIADGKRSELDFAMLFVQSQAALKKQFSEVSRQLAPAGILSVNWPKESVGHQDGSNRRRSAEDRPGRGPRRREGLRCKRDLVGTEIRDPLEGSTTEVTSL